jgi:hypothetical protein
MRVPVSGESTARAIMVHLGAKLREVSVVSIDGIELKGWFAQPFNPDSEVEVHCFAPNQLN